MQPGPSGWMRARDSTEWRPQPVTAGRDFMLCPLRFSQNRSANSLICRRTPPHGSPGAATIPGAHPSACVRLRGDRCRGVRAVRQPVSAGRGPPAGQGPGLGRAQCRLVLPAGDDLVPGIRGRRGAVQVRWHQAR
ncbi:hypothetical protein G6F57_021779 [Rhizopus arrhizus]|nr:hypothetical protein G6F57_021779 [Rhizopus arrhizus]